MSAIAQQVEIPVNTRGRAANTVVVNVNLPPKVQEFAKNLESTVANHPYFRRTWRESARGAVRSFGSLARDAMIRRYGETDAEGRAHFLGMSEKGTETGVFEIIKRFVRRTPEVADIQKPTVNVPKDSTRDDDDTKVESRAAAEEANRENLRLVQIQIDSLKSIDANIKTILGVVTELNKAADRAHQEGLATANNANTPSLFDSALDFLGLGRGVRTGGKGGKGGKAPKAPTKTPTVDAPKAPTKAPTPTRAPRGRGVFARVLNAGRVLATRASTTFSPIATNMGSKIGSKVTPALETIKSGAQRATIEGKNLLGKGLELGKTTLGTAKERAQSFTQNTLRPRVSQLAEKAKTGSAQLLDVAKKGGSRGAELAKEANQSILKMMPKNIVPKLGVVGAVAGGAMAIANYNAQAEEIDKQVARGELSEAEAEAMKSNLIKKGAGSTIGAGIGTAIGSTIGSIIPGAGTIVGGMVGGWLGEKVGGWIGDALSEDPKVAQLQARVDQLNELAENGNLHWTNVRAMRKDVQKANIDQDDKNDLLEQLDELDKDAIKRGDRRTRAVLARTSTGQAVLAQAAESNKALTPNGADTYAQAFNANTPAQKVENSGNTTVTQVNNNSTNNTIRSNGLESRNRDASLRDYRGGNLATVG